MKLILDEWIVREVIDTLYMARTTLLGITELDSPQEVAKKSANETAITQRISKAIDIIQQSDEQQHIPDGMEEAAEKYCEKVNHRQTTIITDSFKAGAEWQKNQMMKEAVDGIARIGYPFLSSNPFVDIQESKDSWCKLMRKFMDGDKVHIFVLKEEEE